MKLKRRTLETCKALGLLALFAVTGTIGFLLAWHNVDVWRGAGLFLDKYSIGADVASARFLVLVGGATFAFSAFCVYNLLRYDLGSKKSRKA